MVTESRGWMRQRWDWVWRGTPLDTAPDVLRQTNMIMDMFNEDPERLLTNYQTYVQEGFKGNGPVFAVVALKALAMSELDFAVRTSDGEIQPPPELLMPPVGDLVARMEIEADFAGNSFRRRVGGLLVPLRPDWVDIIVGVPRDPVLAAAQVTDLLGYVYWPGGRSRGKEPVVLEPEEVAHYAPIPDPSAFYRGQSWLQSVAVEIDSDTYMTRHKAKFFDNAATPNLVVLSEKKVPTDAKKRMRDQFTSRNEGWENAYRTIFLEGGADVRVVGSSLEQMTFSAVQAGGETRIAAAAGVPPVVVGFVQGIQAATYSNYSQAMRRFADLTIRPKWRMLADAMSRVVSLGSGERLWYDDSKVAFLQQDAKDAAEIRKENALTLESHIRAGFTPASSVEAVATNDIAKLEHTGLISVQLLPPGETEDGAQEDDSQ